MARIVGNSFRVAKWLPLIPGALPRADLANPVGVANPHRWSAGCPPAQSINCKHIKLLMSRK
jgi:hypothetical protein